MNQNKGRTCAEVVALCRQKWYDQVPNAEGILQDPIHPKVWIKHCPGEMNEKLKEYAELNDRGKGVSVLLATIVDMQGLPSGVGLDVWKRKAGMMRGVRFDENDLELDGDVYYASDPDNDIDEDDEREEVPMDVDSAFLLNKFFSYINVVHHRHHLNE
jgi:hypothetical protein